MNEPGIISGDELLCFDENHELLMDGKPLGTSLAKHQQAIALAMFSRDGHRANAYALRRQMGELQEALAEGHIFTFLCGVLVGALCIGLAWWAL